MKRGNGQYSLLFLGGVADNVGIFLSVNAFVTAACPTRAYISVEATKA